MSFQPKINFSKTKETKEVDLDTDQEDKKRKRSQNSSVSEHDKSVSTPDAKQVNKPKKKSKKGKKDKKDQELDNLDKIISDFKKIDLEKEEMSNFEKQLEAVNKKLEKVLTRDDPSLKKMIKDVFTEMKDDFLNTVFHRIELLEGKLHDTEDENDKLKKKIKDLDKKLVDQKDETEKALLQVDKVDSKARKVTNELEQYGRRNNIRIDGLTDNGNEDAETTSDIVIDLLNKSIKDLNLNRSAIDTAHRLGKLKGGKRQVIVKFVSRMTRDRVMRGKQIFKGTGIYINEDLTWLNLQVLASLRKKAPEKIESAWSRDGRIMFKNKLEEKSHQLEFKQYRHWLDLEWPEKSAAKIDQSENESM